MAKNNSDSSRSGLTRDEAHALCQKILRASKAEQVRVNIESGWRGNTRVAMNRITSAGGYSSTSVRITSVFGKRLASVSTTQTDDDSLRRAVAESEGLARIAPESPEYMPELGPQEYDEVNGYYASTGALSPEARAEAAAVGIDRAKEAGLFVAAGFTDVEATSTTVATSAGLFAYHAGTGVASTLTVRTPDNMSSGWAGDEAGDWDNIETERIARVAAEKAAAWRNPTELEPGKYTCILEPTAVGMLMLRMLRAFNGRTADEGRSYFSKPGGGNRLGEKLFDDRISIVSDPAYPDAETAPFMATGLPVHAQTWVEKGVLKNLSYSRYWADQQGREPLSRPSNLILEGGTDSLESMIASTERGVLLTRFWYIRPLNPRILSQTGLTRDGTFLIENGKISRPVKNFRFNQSLAEMLQNVEMMSESVRVAASENSSVSVPILAPAIKVRDFNLASVSDAI